MCTDLHGQTFALDFQLGKIAQCGKGNVLCPKKLAGQDLAFVSRYRIDLRECFFNADLPALDHFGLGECGGA